ncbi:MAG: phosphopantetheine-binding protein [Acetobacteraceae bacterium]
MVELAKLQARGTAVVGTGITEEMPAISTRAVAELIVEVLHLEIAPHEIPPKEPLFGNGLGLDSIDALELALAISRAYGFELRSDDARNLEIFASLENLTGHIAAHRTK